MFSWCFCTSIRLVLWICIVSISAAVSTNWGTSGSFMAGRCRFSLWWDAVAHISMPYHDPLHEKFLCNGWSNNHSDCINSAKSLHMDTLEMCCCKPSASGPTTRTQACVSSSFLAAFQSPKLEKCPHFCFSYQITPPLRLWMPQTLCAEGFGDKSWMEMKRPEEMTLGCCFELCGPTCLSWFRKSH